MTSRSGTATGLSTADIDRIRSSLDAGRKPKVVFTAAAGQIAGEVGQVVKLADPDQSDEWLVVRFGRDELPFSPADLSVPPRGRAGRPAGSAGNSGSAGGTSPSPAAVPSPRDPAPAGAAGTAGAAGGRKPAKRAARPARAAGRSRPPAAMTVTLAYQAGEWTVAAHQGSRTLAKPYLVRPAEALRMVAMLDVPGVHDAVEQIVTAELTEAQQRADTLRSELAEVEARLAELRGHG
jgi:hypothetical protein